MINTIHFSVWEEPNTLLRTWAAHIDNNDGIWLNAKPKIGRHVTFLEYNLAALVHICERAPVNSLIICEQEYISKGATFWLDNWVKKGWITSAGEDVKYRSMWEMVLESRNLKNLRFGYESSFSSTKLALAKADAIRLVNEALPVQDKVIHFSENPNWGDNSLSEGLVKNHQEFKEFYEGEWDTKFDTGRIIIVVDECEAPDLYEAIPYQEKQIESAPNKPKELDSSVERTCECGCGKTFKVKRADIKRGYGRFASKSCAARARESKKAVMSGNPDIRNRARKKSDKRLAEIQKQEQERNEKARLLKLAAN